MLPRPLSRVSRPVFALALALLPLTLRAAQPPPDAAAIVRLHGKAFFDAVEQALPHGDPSPFSPDALTRLAIRMAEEMAGEGQGAAHGYEFGRLFAAACGTAGDEQVDALAALFAAQPADPYYERARLISPLALAWARRELRAIHREGRSAVLRGASASLPGTLRAATPELAAAWSAFRQTAAPFQQAFGRNREKPWTSVQDKFPAFYRVIDDLLLGRSGGDAPASEQISRFAWGSWCGTGSEVLHTPQDHARLLALLRERRLEEAAGAALALGPAQGLMAATGESTSGDLAGEVLAGLGLDWETLFAGASLDELSDPQARFSFGGSANLNKLAARGSARGAGLLVALVRFAANRPGERERFIRPLAMLVTPVPEPARGAADGEEEVAELVVSYGHGFRSDGEETERAPEAGPVPAALQREALLLLDALAAPDTDSSALTQLAETFGTLRRPETVPTLRRLAAHPVDEVAGAAAKALAALGETVPDRARAGPVRFRVRLNGEPLARRKVGWTVPLSETSTTGSEAETDADGVLGLEPKYFQDPTRPVREVSLVMDHFHGSRTEPDAPASECVRFQVLVPVPGRIDQITDVDVAVSPLTLRVVRADGQALGPGARVKINGVQPPRAGNGMWPPSAFYMDEFPLPEDGVVTFPRLAPGTYTLEVNAPTRAGWRSGPVVLAEGSPGVLSATLDRGVDVTGRFVRPDGVDVGLPYARLWRDGVEDHTIALDFQARRLCGLAPGRYRLVVAASDATKGRDTHEIVPPESRHGGAEVEFTVGPRTPALLDLGDVPLAPAVGADGR